MYRRPMIGLAIGVSLVGLTGAAVAAPADDFNAAYAKAEAAEQQAGALKNQWTATQAELKSAQAAAKAGNYDEAVKHAQAAEALANASIAQAKEQAAVWTQAVIR
ncbi:MAG: hypothetical protein WBB34_10910 [Xanthobacteraceae bacterium]